MDGHLLARRIASQSGRGLLTVVMCRSGAIGSVSSQPGSGPTFE